MRLHATDGLTHLERTHELVIHGWWGLGIRLAAVALRSLALLATAPAHPTFVHHLLF